MQGVFLVLQFQNLPDAAHDLEVAYVAQTGEEDLVLSEGAFAQCNQVVQD